MTSTRPTSSDSSDLLSLSKGAIRPGDDALSISSSPQMDQSQGASTSALPLSTSNANNQLTPEQADFVRNLYNLVNVVPAPLLTQAITPTRMQGDVGGLQPGLSRATTQIPPPEYRAHEPK